MGAPAMIAETEIAEPDAADSDVSSEGDGITVVLMQLDEEEQDNDTMLSYEEEKNDADPSIAGGSTLDAPTSAAVANHGGAASGAATAVPSAGTPGGGGGATPASSAASTRHKQWVNPKLMSSGQAAGVSPATAATPKPSITAAQKAKLGPLVHVPGGLQMRLEGPMPENIDIDNVRPCLPVGLTMQRAAAPILSPPLTVPALRGHHPPRSFTGAAFACGLRCSSRKSRGTTLAQMQLTGSTMASTRTRGGCTASGSRRSGWRGVTFLRSRRCPVLTLEWLAWGR